MYHKTLNVFEIRIYIIFNNNNIDDHCGWILCEIRCKFYTHLSLSLSLMKKAIIDHIDCGKKNLVHGKSLLHSQQKVKRKWGYYTFFMYKFLASWFNQYGWDESVHASPTFESVCIEENRQHKCRFSTGKNHLLLNKSARYWSVTRWEVSLRETYGFCNGPFCIMVY